jgi:hypothetical protein
MVRGLVVANENGKINVVLVVVAYTHYGGKSASTLGSFGRGQVVTNVQSNKSHPRNITCIPRMALATSNCETLELKMMKPRAL